MADTTLLLLIGIISKRTLLDSMVGISAITERDQVIDKGTD
jgi:hypothetical protein